MDVNTPKHPFTAYDIFGYLIPGTVVLTGLYVHEIVFRTGFLSDFVRSLIPDVQYNHTGTPLAGHYMDWYIYPLALMVGIVVAYVLGHTVASFGSAIIDKSLVERIYGYPYKELFDNKFKKSEWDRQRGCFYKTIFVLAIAIIVCGARMRMTHRATLSLAIAFGVVFGLKLLYTTVHARNLETLVWRSPPQQFWARAAYWAWFLAIQWPLWLIARFVFDTISNILRSLFRMSGPFSDKFQDGFEARFHQKFGAYPEEMKTNTYWLPFTYICRESPSCSRRIQYWLHMYSFARNLSMVFLLLCIYGIISYDFHLDPKMAVAHDRWCAVTGAGTLIFGLRYYYLYYKYFSKFVFRAFFAAVCQ